jgi:hypothetical protein
LVKLLCNFGINRFCCSYIGRPFGCLSTLDFGESPAVKPIGISRIKSQRADKIILDASPTGSGSTGVVPVLPLNEITRQQPRPR